jgi:hypothetical protein
MCPWCERRIKTSALQLHHIDYEHCCVYTDLIKIPNPTPKRPNRVNKVPDCEKCYSKNPTAFSNCISRVVPVHNLCNMEIEIKRVALLNNRSI